MNNDPRDILEDEPERDFYAESQRILKGKSVLLIERRHLEAMEEHHQVTMILIANMLETHKLTVLEMP